MAEEAGEENFFLFGLTAEQVASSHSCYNPHWHYDHEPETRAALDLIFADHFSHHEPGIFAPLRDACWPMATHYMRLADLKILLEADRARSSIVQPERIGASKAISNVARSGKCSSNRAIANTASPALDAEALSSVLTKIRPEGVLPLEGRGCARRTLQQASTSTASECQPWRQTELACTSKASPSA